MLVQISGCRTAGLLDRVDIGDSACDFGSVSPVMSIDIGDGSAVAVSLLDFVECIGSDSLNKCFRKESW